MSMDRQEFVLRALLVIVQTDRSSFNMMAQYGDALEESIRHANVVFDTVEEDINRREHRK